MSETTMNDNPTPQQPQQQPQITLHGGVYPQPDGRWTVSIWFAGFTSEGAAQHMSGQLEQLIKQSFSQQQPPPNPKED